VSYTVQWAKFLHLHALFHRGIGSLSNMMSLGSSRVSTFNHFCTFMPHDGQTDCGLLIIVCWLNCCRSTFIHGLTHSLLLKLTLSVHLVSLYCCTSQAIVGMLSFITVSTWQQMSIKVLIVLLSQILSLYGASSVISDCVYIGSRLQEIRCDFLQSGVYFFDRNDGYHSKLGLCRTKKTVVATISKPTDIR